MNWHLKCKSTISEVGMSTKSSASGKRNRSTSRKARADPAVASLIKDALAGAASGESVLVIDVATLR
jgi:hypothetical protein